MEEMKVMDVFSLMLVEASGDSEVGLDSDENAMDVAEDDAQSCSCEVVDHDCFESEDDDLDYTHHQDQYHDYDGDDGGEECDSGGGDMAAMSGTGKSVQVMKKPRACVDSAMELVNEREKSKLFWEACLAS